jgi:hypothetical protein
VSSYGWIIDHDHTGGTAVGTTGPRDAPIAVLATLQPAVWPNHYGRLPWNVRRFRLYDDDGELLYSGRQYIDPEDRSDTAEFGPLTDYGGPNAGAQWVAL